MNLRLLTGIFSICVTFSIGIVFDETRGRLCALADFAVVAVVVEGVDCFLIFGS